MTEDGDAFGGQLRSLQANSQCELEGLADQSNRLIFVFASGAGDSLRHSTSGLENIIFHLGGPVGEPRT